LVLFWYIHVSFVHLYETFMSVHMARTSASTVSFVGLFCGCLLQVSFDMFTSLLYISMRPLCLFMWLAPQRVRSLLQVSFDIFTSLLTKLSFPGLFWFTHVVGLLCKSLFQVSFDVFTLPLQNVSFSGVFWYIYVAGLFYRSLLICLRPFWQNLRSACVVF